jgi:hypothetical protein
MKSIKEIDPKNAEIDSERVCTILATMMISLTCTIIDRLPAKSRKGRVLTKANESIAAVAALHHMPLTENDVKIGVRVWNAAVVELQSQLAEGAA